MRLIVSNLKMYFDGFEIKNYIDNIKKVDNLVICPSIIHIPYFLNKNISIGLQNISIYDKGAYTGDVSCLQGKNLGLSYVLVGHYERKKYYNESNSIINLKVREALKYNMNVILFVGESLDDRNNGITKDVLKKQIDECLENIDESVIIAYEPIWSIDSKVVPDNDYIDDNIKYIKSISNYYVLYGGSVNKDNIRTLNTISSLDGFVIGYSSCNVNDFNDIISIINNV